MREPISHVETPRRVLAEALHQRDYREERRSISNSHAGGSNGCCPGVIDREPGDAAEQTISIKTRTRSMRGPLFRFQRNVAILSVMLWTLLETPLELETTNDDIARNMIIISKGIVTLVGMLVLSGQQWARVVFAFMLGLSVLAIAPSLGLEIEYSPRYFAWSLVECILKALALLTLLVPTQRKDRG